VPRLFVGIDLPLEIKLSLSKLCAGVPGAKWVEPWKFHLTLRFIGTVDDPTATTIAQCMQSRPQRRALIGEAQPVGNILAPFGSRRDDDRRGDVQRRDLLLRRPGC
jgi:hypothetical protein